jgi:hypothetical protein
MFSGFKMKYVFLVKFKIFLCGYFFANSPVVRYKEIRSERANSLNGNFDIGIIANFQNNGFKFKGSQFRENYTYHNEGSLYIIGINLEKKVTINEHILVQYCSEIQGINSSRSVTHYYRNVFGYGYSFGKKLTVTPIAQIGVGVLISNVGKLNRPTYSNYTNEYFTQHIFCLRGVLQVKYKIKENFHIGVAAHYESDGTARSILYSSSGSSAIETLFLKRISFPVMLSYTINRKTKV